MRRSRPSQASDLPLTIPYRTSSASDDQLVKLEALRPDDTLERAMQAKLGGCNRGQFTDRRDAGCAENEVGRAPIAMASLS